MMTSVIQRLGAIAFLHDIGKANRGFQNKCRLPPNARAARGIDVAGHVGELYPLLIAFAGSGQEKRVGIRLSPIVDDARAIAHEALAAALADVQGISTRKVKAISEELCGHSFRYRPSVRSTSDWTRAWRSSRRAG